MKLTIEHANGEETEHKHIRCVTISDAERIVTGYWEHEGGTKLGYREDLRPKRIVLDFEAEVIEERLERWVGNRVTIDAGC